MFYPLPLSRFNGAPLGCYFVFLKQISVTTQPCQKTLAKFQTDLISLISNKYGHCQFHRLLLIIHMRLLFYGPNTCSPYTKVHVAHNFDPICDALMKNNSLSPARPQKASCCTDMYIRHESDFVVGSLLGVWAKDFKH